MEINYFKKIEENYNKTINFYKEIENKHLDISIKVLLNKYNKLYNQLCVNISLGIIDPSDLNLFFKISNKLKNENNIDKNIKEIDTIIEIFDKKMIKYENKINFKYTINYVIIPSIILFVITFVLLKIGK